MRGQARINLGDIGREFSATFHSNPNTASYHDGADPVTQMFRRSQGMDLVRQVLPGWAGGYSQERKAKLSENLRSDPHLRQQVMQAGNFSVTGHDPAASASLPRAQRIGLTTAQVTGAIASDITSQGLQNVYWFLNAPEAVAMLGGRAAMHGATAGIKGAPTGSPFQSHNPQTQAVFPLILGAGLASGTLARPEGYAAVLPDTEGDRRDSTNPVAEAAYRAIGRTGQLLPYPQFFEERPDVSAGQYAQYQAYKHGNKSPLKATWDGIHGPEVAILGRSVPLLTGILPIVGGALAGRAGVRMAGNRLANHAKGNQYAKRTELRDLTRAAREKWEKAGAADRPAAKAVYEDRARQWGEVNRRVEGTLLVGGAAGAAAGMGVTAAGAQLLEGMRRRANMEAEKEKSRERRALNEVESLLEQEL